MTVDATCTVVWTVTTTVLALVVATKLLTAAKRNTVYQLLQYLAAMFAGREVISKILPV